MLFIYFKKRRPSAERKIPVVAFTPKGSRRTNLEAVKRAVNLARIRRRKIVKEFDEAGPGQKFTSKRRELERTLKKMDWEPPKKWKADWGTSA